MSAGSYSQNFNPLATSGTANPWTDSVTLPGWYAAKSVGQAAITEYRASTGSDNTGALYSFGSAGSPERALGSICSITPGSIAYGVRFTNDTASAQTNITISYTGEQWRNANGATAETNILAFSYRVSNAAILSADASNSAYYWLPFSPLNFAAPVVSAIASSLNGNDATNRRVFANVVITGLVVYPGQELFLRWRDVDNVSSDAGIAIDDLTVTFTPMSASLRPVSLLTWNVKGNGATDWSTNAAQVQAIGRQLLYLQPDIITFNEIPVTYTWQMTNWVTAFLPGYYLATNSGSDGFIRSVIASRYPIERSSSWLDDADLKPFGYSNGSSPNADHFTRDLFEAQIAVPNFRAPLHVFTTHLKATSGTTYADASAKRAAEGAAISNFFVTTFFVQFPGQPYTLSGDLNEENTNTLAIQRLVSAPTGLRLTNPTNPFTGSINTYSTASANPADRLDYILPNAVMFAGIASSQVFRTDKLTPLPPNLNSDDSQIASDHYPVLMIFNNPFGTPFRLLSFSLSNQVAMLRWESESNRVYGIESSTDLSNWSTLTSNLTATGTNLSFSTNVSGDVRFFRVYRSP